MSPEKVNLAEKPSPFDERWSPKVVDEFSGQHMKLLGEFVWHRRDEEDELLFVVKGRSRMECGRVGQDLRYERWKVWT